MDIFFEIVTCKTCDRGDRWDNVSFRAVGKGHVQRSFFIHVISLARIISIEETDADHVIQDIGNLSK